MHPVKSNPRTEKMRVGKQAFYAFVLVFFGWPSDTPTPLLCDFAWHTGCFSCILAVVLKKTTFDPFQMHRCCNGYPCSCERSVASRESSVWDCVNLFWDPHINIQKTKKCGPCYSTSAPQAVVKCYARLMQLLALWESFRATPCIWESCRTIAFGSPA